MRDWASPEGTPADVALAEVLVACGLVDQQLHLLTDLQTLISVEVPARQLVPHPLHDVQGFLIQRLGFHRLSYIENNSENKNFLTMRKEIRNLPMLSFFLETISL